MRVFGPVIGSPPRVAVLSPLDPHGLAGHVPVAVPVAGLEPDLGVQRSPAAEQVPPPARDADRDLLLRSPGDRERGLADGEAPPAASGGHLAAGACPPACGGDHDGDGDPARAIGRRVSLAADRHIHRLAVEAQYAARIPWCRYSMAG